MDFSTSIIEKHMKLIEKYHTTNSEEDRVNLREYESYLRNNNLAIIDYGVRGEKGVAGDPRGPVGHSRYLKLYGFKDYIKKYIIKRLKRKIQSIFLYKK